jgi:Na+-translocating ferredoxin:NAD+ oxidoreductase subunit G
MIREAVTRNSLVLSLFAISTAAVLALTNAGTLERIHCNREQALKASLVEVMPAAQFDNALLADVIQVEDPLLGRGAHSVYRARRDGEPAGLVLQSNAEDGYGGTIRLLVGVMVNGTITGVRVIPPHNETPGLGDAIDIRKSDWITRFNGRSLTNPGDNGWAVKKDGGIFDAFTGATITPRAVVGAVHRTLQYVAREQQALFDLPATADTLERCDD